jgi:hypothetical protein
LGAWRAGLLFLGLLATGLGPVSAEEAVGKRFFSDTLVISEPFVEDELSLPSLLHIRHPARGDEPRRLATRIGGEFKKRLTPNLELSLADGLTHLDPDGSPSLTGVDNLEVGLKYQFFKSEPHEAVLSVALGWEIGGTGRKATGAESFDVVSPALLFGKGFGDLPDGLSFVKPFAVSAILEGNVPTRASTRTTRSGGAGVEVEQRPNILHWGFAVEYSLPYLQAFVKDLGLPIPFSRMFPLIEMDFHTALDRGASGKTTGTANPGIVWALESFQIGLEAIVPVNDRTGKTVGVRAFLRFSLDELLPGRLGRPLFGEAR